MHVFIKELIYIKADDNANKHGAFFVNYNCYYANFLLLWSNKMHSKDNVQETYFFSIS